MGEKGQKVGRPGCGVGKGARPIDLGIMNLIESVPRFWRRGYVLCLAIDTHGCLFRLLMTWVRTKCGI